MRVRETVPDSVLVEAPTRSSRRPHPAGTHRSACRRARSIRERVPGRAEQLLQAREPAALRELALREVAEEVETKRRVPSSRRRHARGARARPGAEAIGERLLALIRPTPVPAPRPPAGRSSQRLDGRARPPLRGAPRTVRAPGSEQLETLRRLAAVLGAHLLIEPGDDVAGDRRPRRARARHHLRVAGRAAPSGGLGAAAEPLVMSLMRRLPGVDVRMRDASS